MANAPQRASASFGLSGIDTSSNPQAFTTDPQQSAVEHGLSDVDVSQDSQHHTLGNGPTQAAPGNHTHAIASSAVLPVASSTWRGAFYLLLGDGSTTADTLHICLLQATGAYSWKTVTVS